MEYNLTKKQIDEHVRCAHDLCEKKTAIDMAALNGIKKILKACENHILAFSDKEDDDENFSINVFTDWGEEVNLLVDDVRMKNNTIILRAEGNDYNIWETDKSATDVYQYMVDEIEFDLELESNE